MKKQTSLYRYSKFSEKISYFVFKFLSYKAKCSWQWMLNPTFSYEYKKNKLHLFLKSLSFILLYKWEKKKIFRKLFY